MNAFKRAVLILVFAGAIAHGPSARADDLSAAQILQNHEQAVGYSMSDGKAKPFIEDWTTTWVDENGGNHASLSELHQAGPLYRETTDYAGGHRAEGFDGSVFWKSSLNDSLTADRGYMRPFDVTMAVIQSEGYDASVSPTLQNVTGNAYVIRIHPPDGAVADVYIDKTTWLVDQFILDPEGGAFREELADYKQFGPVHVAMTRRFNGSTASVTKFVWDAPLTGDDLSAPDQAPYLSFPPSGTATMSFDPHDGIVIQGSINGVSARFAVDPDDNGISVTPLLAQKAGLIKPNVDARFAFGNPEDFVSMPRADIQFGGMDLKQVHVAIFSNNFFDRAMSYDGFLGLDVLANAVTTVDFDHDTVTFTDPKISQPPTGWTGLPIALDDGYPQTIAFANGDEKVYMQLGLAWQGSLMFWESYLKTHTDVTENQSAGGGFLKSFKIGPYEQDIVAGASLRLPPGYSLISDGDGMIGYGVLDAFDLILDYPDSMIYLKPTAKSAK